MKCIQFTIGLFVVAFLAAPAFGSQRESNTRIIALNIVERCQNVDFDTQTFNKDRVGVDLDTRSWRLSSLHAALDKQIDQSLYSKVRSLGIDEETALEVAGTYRYSDNTSFCIELRAQIKAELLDWIHTFPKR